MSALFGDKRLGRTTSFSGTFQICSTSTCHPETNLCGWLARNSFVSPSFKAPKSWFVSSGMIVTDDLIDPRWSRFGFLNLVWEDP